MKKRDRTPAEEKLDQIRDILFPPASHSMNEAGQKYMIDYSADMNLDAALTDLEEGHNDEVSQKTIRQISDRLYQVRRILRPEGLDMGEAEYLVVDDLSEEAYEKIQAKD
jgi:hypothetical protein